MDGVAQNGSHFPLRRGNLAYLHWERRKKGFDCIYGPPRAPRKLAATQKLESKGRLVIYRGCELDSIMGNFVARFHWEISIERWSQLFR